MQVEAYSVDWKEATRRYKAETLTEDFYEAVDDGAEWLTSAKRWNDSQSHHDAVMEAMEAVEGELSWCDQK
jgi:hypothetical protein